MWFQVDSERSRSQKRCPAVKAGLLGNWSGEMHKDQGQEINGPRAEVTSMTAHHWTFYGMSNCKSTVFASLLAIVNLSLPQTRP